MTYQNKRMSRSQIKLMVKSRVTVACSVRLIGILKHNAL